MIFRIPQGRHRARPLRLGVYWNQRSFTWQVRFTESCRYDLHGPDQLDTNKLCGIGYLPGHHHESARFGWRYNAGTDQIELLAYCYVKGNRTIKHIAFCEIGKTYQLDLKCLYYLYYFACCEVINGALISGAWADVENAHNKKLGYPLGVFFGGNQPAPHDIKIQLDKL